MQTSDVAFGLTNLPWKDFVTLGAAVLGAALGIMNTWSSVNQRRVRLAVRQADHELT